MCSSELHWLNSLVLCLSVSVSLSSLHVQTPTHPHKHTLTHKLGWHIGVVTSAGCRLAQRNTTEIPSRAERGTPQWWSVVFAPVLSFLGWYFVLELASKPTVYLLINTPNLFFYFIVLLSLEVCTRCTCAFTAISKCITEINIVILTLFHHANTVCQYCVHICQLCTGGACEMQPVKRCFTHKPTLSWTVPWQ